MTPFQDLGKALRYLRNRRNLKQYEAAELAGITRAMLCAYELGSREPSLTTLGKILTALDTDLVELQAAIDHLQQEARQSSERRSQAHPPDPSQDARLDLGELPGGSQLESLLGLDGPLNPDEEAALLEMFRGFLRWVGFVRRSVSQPGAEASAPSPKAGGLGSP